MSEKIITSKDGMSVGPPPIHGNDGNDGNNQYGPPTNNNNNGNTDGNTDGNNQPYHTGGGGKKDFNMDLTVIGYTDHDVDVNLFLKKNFDPCFIINNSKYSAWRDDALGYQVQIGSTLMNSTCYPVGAILIKSGGNSPASGHIDVYRETGYSNTETTEIQRDTRFSIGIFGANAGFKATTKSILETDIHTKSQLEWSQTFPPNIPYYVYQSVLYYVFALDNSDSGLASRNTSYKIKYINGKNYLFTGVYRNDVTLSKTDCTTNIPTEKDFVDYLASHPEKWIPQ